MSAQFDQALTRETADLRREVEGQAAQNAALREALEGIEVIEHGSEDNGTKEVWFLLRSDGDKIGAGSVHLTGLFAAAMSLWAAKRRAALAASQKGEK